jgi:putative tricarboxylic transport membrane protein
MQARAIRTVRSIVTALAFSALTIGAASAEIRGLDIVVPAAPGGGWDQTARVMQEVLREEKLASRIQINNIPGAGGTIGLAQFVTAKKGRGDALMTTGYVMVGSIILNKSPVTLDDVTPLARLAGEYEALVVPTDSELKSLDDVIKKLRADPGSVSWGGGSSGGSDHILAGMIAKAAGVDPTKVNYIAHAGGGEALSSIFGGHVTVGLSGWQEFAPQVKAGKLRVLALSAPERVEGIDAPTFKEQGIDVDLLIWRAVMAPPGISEKDLNTLSEAIDKMVKSDKWKKILAERGWLDLYQPRAEFTEYLAKDKVEVTATLSALGMVK